MIVLRSKSCTSRQQEWLPELQRRRQPRATLVASSELDSGTRPLLLPLAGSVDFFFLDFKNIVYVLEGPVPLVLDLLISHERFGSTSEPSINGHMHYPNDLDDPLNETDPEKIR